MKNMKTEKKTRMIADVALGGVDRSQPSEEAICEVRKYVNIRKGVFENRKCQDLAVGLA